MPCRSAALVARNTRVARQRADKNEATKEQDAPRRGLLLHGVSCTEGDEVGSPSSRAPRVRGRGE